MSHFSLSRHPFAPPRSENDVYTDHLSDAEVRVTAAIDMHRITAVVGPTGSGKSVLMERVIASLSDIHISRIRSVARARLSGMHLCDALLSDISARTAYGSIETRARAVQEMLADLHVRGQRALLWIDDAHEVPTQTLRDAKRLHEIVSIFKSPLSIILSGQPALMRRLSSEAPLREVYNRTEIVEMPAVDVEGYIDWSIRAAGGNTDEIFTPCGLSAIAEHVEAATPLAVGRLASRAIQEASGIKEQVSAAVVSYAA